MEIKGTYTYPALITQDDTAEYVYAVSFPDLPGCLTEGRTITEARRMAAEALGLHLYGMLQSGDELPKASDFLTGTSGMLACCIYVTVNMEHISDLAENRMVKKTVTIPAKINMLAEQAGINFSETLRQALKEKLGVE